MLQGLTKAPAQVKAGNGRGKILNIHAKSINLKYQLQRGMKNSNYLIDHSLCQACKIILGISSKSMKH